MICAVQTDQPTILQYDRLTQPETQPVAPLGLGGEERLKGPLLIAVVHSVAIIENRDTATLTSKVTPIITRSNANPNLGGP
jgi:hypothetical protein